MITKQKIKEEFSSINYQVKEKISGYIVAALGLVAGLAWNDAIKSFIEYFFPLEGNGLLAKLIYAVVITLLVVFTSIYIIRILKVQKK